MLTSPQQSSRSFADAKRLLCAQIGHRCAGLTFP
jgi:hypothetical protein